MDRGGVINNTVFGLNAGYSVLWISVLYLVGAAIKKYGFSVISLRKKEYPRKYYVQRAVICVLLMGGSKLFFCIIETYFLKGRGMISSLFYNYLSPLVIAEAILLLFYFKDLKIKYNDNLVKIGRLTFGIYLIHQTTFFETLVWKFFSQYNTCGFWGFLVALIVESVIIFVGCGIIEWCRSKLFGVYLVQKMVNYITVKLGLCWKILKKCDT